jgi:tetratricopeptide (TPR) repeat protein
VTSNPLELDPALHEQIKAHCAEGDKLAEAKRYEEAVAAYNKAWVIVPEPRNEWEASTWILASIGDACFLSGYNKSAREALEYAMHCPGGLGNPFLHLRLGQVLFEQNEKDAAADELIRAYMGAGDEIFRAEDPKYSAFLRTRAKLG